MSYYDLLYPNETISDLYESGMSAVKIANKLKSINLGISPNKSMILKYLDSQNIKRRSTHEAMIEWVKSNDGKVWNSGLTAADHESIKRYANSRKGLNNPIHRISHEKRVATNFWKTASDERKEITRTLIKNNLRKWFSNTENYNKWRTGFDNASEKRIKNCREGLKNYFLKCQKEGIVPAQFAIKVSSHEKRIADSLIRLCIPFSQQSMCCSFSYDFMILETNIIIEVQGDYWHMNPKIYSKNDFNKARKKTAKEIWEYDKCKAGHAYDKHGSSVIFLWESDINESTNIELDEIIKKILESKKHYSKSE